MRLIWATRGRAWGFRFFVEGQFSDPLVEYEKLFAGFPEDTEAWHREDDKVAIRFPDPEGRRDKAGRVIPHEFVVFPPLADQINSVADGRRLIWPLVVGTFAELFDHPNPKITQLNLERSA